jgi:hypothetical protein
MPIKTKAEFKKVLNSFSSGLKDVYFTSDKCVKHLISKGQTPQAAQGAVMEILKECERDITNKRYSLVCELLEMTFLDKNVKDININKILGDF